MLDRLSGLEMAPARFLLLTVTCICRAQLDRHLDAESGDV